MTNTEAIKTLRANYPDACYEQLREAVDVAIEALKAQDKTEDADALIMTIIERLVTWYYKKTGFLEHSWGIDGHTDICIQSREYTSDGYRIGTMEGKYEAD